MKRFLASAVVSLLVVTPSCKAMEEAPRAAGAAAAPPAGVVAIPIAEGETEASIVVRASEALRKATGLDPFAADYLARACRLRRAETRDGEVLFRYDLDQARHLTRFAEVLANPRFDKVSIPYSRRGEIRDADGRAIAERIKGIAFENGFVIRGVEIESADAATAPFRPEKGAVYPYDVRVSVVAEGPIDAATLLGFGRDVPGKIVESARDPFRGTWAAVIEAEGVPVATGAETIDVATSAGRVAGRLERAALSAGVRRVITIEVAGGNLAAFREALEKTSFGLGEGGNASLAVGPFVAPGVIVVSKGEVRESLTVTAEHEASVSEVAFEFNYPADDAAVEALLARKAAGETIRGTEIAPLAFTGGIKVAGVRARGTAEGKVREFWKGEATLDASTDPKFDPARRYVLIRATEATGATAYYVFRTLAKEGGDRTVFLGYAEEESRAGLDPKKEEKP